MKLPVSLRATGPLDLLDAQTLRAVNDRSVRDNTELREQTASIIQRVRARGDQALREFAIQYDGVDIETFEIPRARCIAALDAIDVALRAALERAATNIETVHRAFLPTVIEVSPEPGIVVARRPDPLARVGVYAPGGRAAYPSSLLMGAIPARVAGVGEIVVCSPPTQNGLPTQVVMAAAALAEADRVFAIGGAGAIAAMALGTQTVPRVDRIVGPGNAFVAEAKLQLVSHVAIDAPAGPSELLVLADNSADADTVAREMTAQAEHDPEAAVIAIVFGVGASSHCATILESLATHLDATPRGDIVRQSLASRGAIISIATESDAITFANNWASEHLLLMVRDERVDTIRDQLRAVGTVFIGASSSVAFGDYMTGANHVLPTAGSARSYSGLSTLDFVRWTTWQRVTPDAAASLADSVAVFASAEGLPAHASAARAWLRTPVSPGTAPSAAT